MARLSPARLLAMVACAVYAIVAVASGLDRDAAYRQSLADGLPPQLESQGLAKRVNALIGAGQPQAARPLAARLVSRDPIDPSSSALLGASLLGSGDVAGADRAFRVAGQMGWRVEYTQRYWMAQSLAMGDGGAAALHLDALLRTKPALAADPTLFAPFEASPQGEALLVDRLALRPDWFGSYASAVDGLDADQAQARADVLGQLAARGLSLGCAGSASLVMRLLDQHATPSAVAMWHAQCPGTARDGVNDGAFVDTRLDQAPSPLAWEFRGAGDLGVTIEGAASNRRVVVSSSAQVPRDLVGQLVPLVPGDYRLSWLSAAPSAAAPSIAAQAGCSGDPVEWLPARYDASSRRWNAQFTVDSACDGRWLVIAVMPPSAGVAPGGIGTVWFGGVTITPLTAPFRTASSR